MSISSANATIYITIPLLFPTPQQLQQFAADDIFGTEAIEAAESSMGVDGVLTAGFVNVPTKQTYAFQADSPSLFVFDQWFQQQKAAQDVFPCSGTILLTSVGTKWAMVRGFLTSYQPLPDAKKKLEPRKMTITWQSALPAPS